MKRARGIYYGAMFVAVATLAIGYGAVGLWWTTPAILLIAAIWLWSDRRSKAWVGSICLATLTIAAAISSLLNVTTVWSIAAVSAGLIVWDIGRFERLLASVSRINETESIERHYRRRLISVIVLGALIAISTTLIRLSFGFSVALFLGLVSVIGFSRAISYLRQESA